MNAGEKPTSQYALTFGLGIATDLAQLNAIEPTALDAAEAILDDLALGE